MLITSSLLSITLLEKLVVETELISFLIILNSIPNATSHLSRVWLIIFDKNILW